MKYEIIMTETCTYSLILDTNEAAALLGVEATDGAVTAAFDMDDAEWDDNYGNNVGASDLLDTIIDSGFEFASDREWSVEAT